MNRQEYLDKIVGWFGYIDNNLSEEENLLFQLNHDNGSTYTIDDIEFSLPEETDELVIPLNSPNNPIEVNTKVIVSAKPTSKFRGSDSYLYRRIDLKVQWDILNGDTPFILPEAVKTDDQIKTFLLTKMPFREDSVNVSRVFNSAGLDYVEVRAKSNSYLYINSLTIDINGTSKLDGPIGKIKRGSGIAGVEYVTRQKLGLQGVEYVTKNKVSISGLDYSTTN